eukprot:gnl/TRDRNA2_/TRDRNA2_147320_c4_seq1.p1 gnl/TRDRNA2_/TRDRNA2_147320_c4~~gnl/TRDRNA2_/TRDRNA2_147320_c4_seq1.p1  ORF type:complete len:113 (-),score=2.60 gnl/TRDRNA2_/TRDRNA2_147320_c4_seq1:37-375(-)
MYRIVIILKMSPRDLRHRSPRIDINSSFRHCDLLLEHYPKELRGDSPKGRQALWPLFGGFDLGAFYPKLAYSLLHYSQRIMYEPHASSLRFLIVLQEEQRSVRSQASADASL